MTFEELLAVVRRRGEVGVCVDSRLVQNGDVFVAIKGSISDGHEFIGQAVEKGAGFIVCERVCETQGAELIVVEDSAEAAAMLGQAKFGEPAKQLTNLAVTGTNGKTTVTFMVRSIIEHTGGKCGVIGTVGYDTGEESFEARLTTPDSLTVASLQRGMVGAGAKFAAIEASSHALSQNRLGGIDFKAAAFTNLTGDHLDYHITEEDYLAAKGRLFEGLGANAVAVLNKQSEAAAKIAAKTEAEILWYAVDESSDLSARVESSDIARTVFVLEYAGEKQKVRTNLLGLFNVSNCLAAAGLCLAAGFELEAVAAGLSALEFVPGRLERIECEKDFSVFIDYAHTDDALKNVLSTLKTYCTGRLIVVFGCGGDRDATKRPRMGRIAEEFADFVIVTSDNPRTEEPEGIIGEIYTGFENPGSETIDAKLDRGEAIGTAIKMAKRDDIILIAGKGHESYQIIGTERKDFSDKRVAMGFLEERG